MGASTPKATPTPPEPETVKRTASEVERARSGAKNAAAGKYGVSGTNVTKGTVTAETAETKKKTLGGE